MQRSLGGCRTEFLNPFARHPTTQTRTRVDAPTAYSLLASLIDLRPGVVHIAAAAHLCLTRLRLHLAVVQLFQYHW